MLEISSCLDGYSLHAVGVAKRSKELRGRRLRALGIAIRTRRETLGLSQTDFAAEVGSSRGGVWQWESGEIAPTADRLWEICDVLECTPAELFSTADEVDLDLEDD